MSPELSRGSTLLVFQYGSNMDRARLNSSDRLDGAAELRGLAETIDGYDLVFNVWSSGQQCAVANLVKGPHTIYGVLYEIPDFRVLRTLKQGPKTLDEIEGEGQTYERTSIGVKFGGKRTEALTYLGKQPSFTDRGTTNKYAHHIIKGLEELDAPAPYVDYVKNCIAGSLTRAN
jgi:gamma-glutamylcyclotransferase (GGCT)/AIG2-like uncharacterized protein YtfP